MFQLFSVTKLQPLRHFCEIISALPNDGRKPFYWDIRKYYKLISCRCLWNHLHIKMCYCYRSKRTKETKNIIYESRKGVRAKDNIWSCDCFESKTNTDLLFQNLFRIFSLKILTIRQTIASYCVPDQKRMENIQILMFEMKLWELFLWKRIFYDHLNKKDSKSSDPCHKTLDAFSL